MDSKLLLLFPPCQGEASLVLDVTEDFEHHMLDKTSRRAIQNGFLRPTLMTDAVQTHGRPGYLYILGRWFVYKACCNADGWVLKGQKAKKLPPHAIQLHIQYNGKQLPELLLDTDPLVRNAAKKYYNRIHKENASILSDK